MFLVAVTRSFLVEERRFRQEARPHHPPGEPCRWAESLGRAARFAPPDSRGGCRHV